MINYNETQIAGTAWQRAYKVEFMNELGKVPYVHYMEEKVVDLGNGEYMHKLMGDLGGPAAPTIELRDPATGLLTGESISMDVVSVALYSDYINRALARDAFVVESMVLAAPVATFASGVPA